MTRDEFIDRYMENSGFSAPEAVRTHDGFVLDDWKMVALPCVCGEDGCQGWAMIFDDPASILLHKFYSGPDEGKPTYPELQAAIKNRAANRHSRS